MARKPPPIIKSLGYLYKQIVQHEKYLREELEKIQGGSREANPHIPARQFAATYVLMAKMMEAITPQQRKFEQERKLLKRNFREVEILHSRIMSEESVAAQTDIFISMNKKIASGIILLARVLKKAGLIDNAEE